MLLSICLLFLVGIGAGELMKRLGLPALLGMLLAGIFMGPYALGLLDNSLLNISTQLRQMALVIILLRAGLSLDIEKLKKIGLSAALMCFVPACFEIGAAMVFAPVLFKFSLVEAALLGAVIAAVSPAVIVPKMLNLMEQGYGNRKGIPQMILSGASVDDVFVIVLFTSFLGIAQGKEVSGLQLLTIPLSIVLGIVGGLIIGILISKLFCIWNTTVTMQTLILLSVSFFLVGIEDVIKPIIPFSGLLAVMACGVCVQKKRQQYVENNKEQLSKLWIAAEAVLFVLVGASVNILYLFTAGVAAGILLAGTIFVRMIGVFVSTLPAKLNVKEQLFCMIAYTPKATVQAAIGGIPLSAGLACGNTILAVAVLSIMLTAPIGAFLIERLAPKFLEKE